MRATRLRNSLGIGSGMTALAASGSIVAPSRASSAPSSALARTQTCRGAGAGSELTATVRSFCARSAGPPDEAMRRGASAWAAVR